MRGPAIRNASSYGGRYNRGASRANTNRPIFYSDHRSYRLRPNSEETISSRGGNRPSKGTFVAQARGGELLFDTRLHASGYNYSRFSYCFRTRHCYT